MSGVMKLSGVAVMRGERPLLSALDCELRTGEVTVVLGPNGAGKSSLLLALAGLIPADGEIELSGRPLTDYGRDELSRSVAWQGDLPPAEFGLTVRQRLELAAGEMRDAFESAVEAMDIALLLDRALGELSSGERQRVEIAAVMVRDCPLWLLDEPTAHLDLKHQMAVLRMMREQAAKGRTIVTVLHDLQQAVAVADCVVLLDGTGGAEAGRAAGLLTSERLSSLFQVKLISIHSDGQAVLLPDFRL